MSIRKKNVLVFFILTLTYIFMTEFSKYLLDIDKLQYNYLSSSLTISQIEKFFSIQKQFFWVTYLTVLLSISIKSFLVSSIIYIGILINHSFKINFRDVFNIVLKAEFIFVVAIFLKLLWFFFFKDDYTFLDFQNFQPLSALNIIGYKNLDLWYVYPFQVLNLFELAYVVYLSFQVAKLTKSNPDRGLKIISLSYVPALFLWVVIVMFIYLNLF